MTVQTTSMATVQKNFLDVLKICFFGKLQHSIEIRESSRLLKVEGFELEFDNSGEIRNHGEIISSEELDNIVFELLSVVESKTIISNFGFDFFMVA